MNRFARTYAVSIAAFFAMDLVWLGWVASGFYARHLESLLRPDVLWAPALLFYALFVAGVVHFVTLPAAGSIRKAAMNGAFFGFVTYATFDLTCLALFRDFPVIVVLVDLVWGAVLTGTVAAVGARFGGELQLREDFAEDVPVALDVVDDEGARVGGRLLD